MYHYKSFKSFFLVFSFILITFGLLASSCATGKNLNKVDAGMSVSAAGTSRGILLQINNIPEEINGLNITLWDISEVDYLQKQVYIKGEGLAELRKSGELLCPFVKNSHEYRVQIFTYSEADQFSTQLYSVSAVASGGIYPVNNPQLSFNDEYKQITLSAKPIFSDEVVYAKDGLFLNYYLSVHNDNGEYMHSGGEEWMNDLSFDFPWMTSEPKPFFRMSGNVLVDATVRCILKYGNMEWDVGIVKTTQENISSL
jgi:hypothetical protein